MGKKKKSYNPFKMKGPWIGFVLGIIFILFMGDVSDGGTGCIGFCISFFDLFMNITVFGIAGFLLGWAIHSVIRKYSK